jgi:DNA-binding response OmpR family regulator
MTDGVTIPTNDTASPPPPAPAPPSHRILVVDDDASFRQLNTKVLTHSGYAVNAAEDGAAAWEALTTGRYDLMITDNVMPKMTGVELIVNLRAARMALPVIMTTATVPTPDSVPAAWPAPAAMLLKPYSIADLLGTVQAVLHATRDVAGPESLPPGGPGQPAAANYSFK